MISKLIHFFELYQRLLFYSIHQHKFFKCHQIHRIIRCVTNETSSLYNNLYLANFGRNSFGVYKIRTSTVAIDDPVETFLANIFMANSIVASNNKMANKIFQFYWMLEKVVGTFSRLYCIFYLISVNVLQQMELFVTNRMDYSMLAKSIFCCYK